VRCYYYFYAKIVILFHISFQYFSFLLIVGIEGVTKKVTGFPSCIKMSICNEKFADGDLPEDGRKY